MHRILHFLNFEFDISFNLTLLVIFISIVLIWLWKRISNKRHSLPGPFPWPVVGNIPTLAGAPRLYKRLLELREEYGDIIQLRMGPSMNFVVVFSNDLIRELLVDQGEKTEYRPNWVYVTDKMFHKTGIIWSNGPHWHHLRKFAIHALKDLGFYQSNLEGKIMEEINFLISAINKGKNIRMEKLMPKAVSNVISHIVFGARFEYDDHDFEMILDVLDFIFKNAGIHLPENFMPVLADILPNSMAKKCVKEKERFDEYVKKQIKEHKQFYNPEETRDFIDIYLHHINNNEDNIEEISLFHMIFDLFAAGSETTSTTLLWLILYLINYPDVQDLCRKEISKVAGLRPVLYKDKDKMPYILAVIDEVQRIASIGPIGLPRACMEDVKIAGKVIPKQSIIIPHFMSAHYDEAYWENPNEFRPERFLSEDGNYIKHKDAFYPFSVGARNCIGKHVAEMELFLFTTNIIQHCRMRNPTPEKPLDLEGIQSGVTLLPKPYLINIKDRANSVSLERQMSCY